MLTVERHGKTQASFRRCQCRGCRSCSVSSEAPKGCKVEEGQCIRKPFFLSRRHRTRSTACAPQHSRDPDRLRPGRRSPHPCRRRRGTPPLSPRHCERPHVACGGCGLRRPGPACAARGQMLLLPGSRPPERVLGRGCAGAGDGDGDAAEPCRGRGRLPRRGRRLVRRGAHGGGQLCGRAGPARRPVVRGHRCRVVRRRAAMRRPGGGRHPLRRPHQAGPGDAVARDLPAGRRGWRRPRRRLRLLRSAAGAADAGSGGPLGAVQQPAAGVPSGRAAAPAVCRAADGDGCRGAAERGRRTRHRRGLLLQVASGKGVRCPEAVRPVIQRGVRAERVRCRVPRCGNYWVGG